MSATIRLLAPAKLNLFLEITGRLDPQASGLHQLASLFVHIDLADRIALSPSPATALHLDQSRGLGPEAVRASFARADAWLAEQIGRASPLEPLSVTLEKRIPVAAGLGGGSVDLAAYLRGRLMLLGLLPKSANRSLPFALAQAVTLGADLPAALDGQPRYVSGVGEVLERRVSLPEGLHFVLLDPRQPLSTGAVFARYRLQTGDQTDPRAARFSAPIADPPTQLSDYDRLLDYLKSRRNDLQPLANVDAVLALLAEAGADLPRMSGSGSVCFTPCRNREAAAALAATLQARRPEWRVYTAAPVTQGFLWAQG